MSPSQSLHWPSYANLSRKKFNFILFMIKDLWLYGDMDDAITKQSRQTKCIEVQRWYTTLEQQPGSVQVNLQIPKYKKWSSPLNDVNAWFQAWLQCVDIL